CIVHGYRNIVSHVPSTKVREIAAMLKAIHAGEDIAAAREKAIRVIKKLRGLRLSRAAELVEMAVEGNHPVKAAASLFAALGSRAEVFFLGEGRLGGVAAGFGSAAGGFGLERDKCFGSVGGPPFFCV